MMRLSLFLFLFLHNKNKDGGCLGAIVSTGEPDWSIAKADMVDEIYSYEPYVPGGREFKSLFPFFRQPQQPQQQPPQHQQHHTNIQRISKVSHSNSGALNSKSSFIFPPTLLQQASSKIIQRQFPGQNKQSSGGYLPPQGQNQRTTPTITSPSRNDTPPPIYTKFSMDDKKLRGTQPSPAYNHPNVKDQGGYSTISGLGSMGPLGKPLIGPVYEHQQQETLTTPQPLGLINPSPSPSSHLSSSSFISSESSGAEAGIGRNNVPMAADATAVDSQTIVWPENMAQNLMTNDEETQVRFLVHKTGDEEIIKNALVTDGQHRNQDVKFIEGPMLRIQRHQKVYLPPKKKTVVYILLKEPQIITDVEVVGPTEEPVPEVFITYQKSDGGVKTKHYSPDVVKNDKYLSQLRESATSALSTDVNLQELAPNDQLSNSNSYGQSQLRRRSVAPNDYDNKKSTMICPTVSIPNTSNGK